MTRLLSVLVVMLSIAPAWAQSDTKGFYRFPTLHANTIVFAAEGDLWTVPLDGGLARRLTTHPAEESHPVISPDGRLLAFTARYEGTAEVYTMPVEGGLPTRRTYEGDTSTVTTWTPGGDLVYGTTHYATLPDVQLVSLNLPSGERRRIALSQASEGAFDASGRTLYFVRPAFHRNVTKRYMGGTARKIWKFTEGSAEAVPLTLDYKGESHTPMWWDGRVYFVSDRDGTMNLWSMDENGTAVRQHTTHSGWDVRTPQLNAGRIVYEVGADLWLYDIASDLDRMIPITLASDFDQLREKWVKNPMENLTSVHLHPKGESVVLTARGRVFVAPVKQGRLVQSAREAGVRYRDVTFMPDGGTLLGLSDATGELEFVTIPANGVGAPTALTDDGAILRFDGHPSPDGKRIAYTDNNDDLWLLEVGSRAQTVISTNREGVRDLAWSPDSRWLAYSQTAPNTFAQIMLYDVERGTQTALTSDRINSVSAVWSPDGKWIYFLSDRNLQSVVGSPWGPRQPEPYFDKPMKLYEVALEAGLRSPFKPVDELHPPRTAGPDESKAASGPSAAPQGPPRTAIALDGIQRRVREIPVPPGAYRDLSANGKILFWLSSVPGTRGGAQLMAIEIGNDSKPVRIVDDVRHYELSRDGGKLLVRQRDDLYVFDAGTKAPTDLAESTIDLSGWTFPIDVREDWRQIFVDAWRLERDYFYDPDMHGVDWVAVRDKFLPLVDRVTTRDELSDVIGQAVGELSALHTSVRGGDLRRGADEVSVPTLGARLVRDTSAGGYRVDYIYRSDPDYPDERSPLADPDLQIAEGDVILRVNGAETLAADHLNALLRNQQDRQVLLTLKSSSTAEVRDVIVIPTTGEANLRYADWEYTRRLSVEEQAGGQVGYVHLRAMGSGDLTAWYRQFYPVFNRPGLIIDVRHNRGGNIDSIILEKLQRQAWSYWKGRTREPSWNMQYAFRGHMVVLVDENTASDGEAFAEGFRRLGLGIVIGTRTWGGEIWLSSVNTLSDGGLARAPMDGLYGPDGAWLIENHGVDPDIVVQNLPHETFNGRDAQLDAAVEFLLGEIRKDPRTVPAPPPFPDKSFPYPTTSRQGGR